jgi:hypothetical protein
MRRVFEVGRLAEIRWHYRNAGHKSAHGPGQALERVSPAASTNIVQSP